MSEISPRISEVLERSQVQYTIKHHAECDRPIDSPTDFAAALGYEVDRITKSLFTFASNEGRYVMLVCPASRKVDFTRASKAVGVRRLEIAAKRDLAEILGYPTTGVSPLGMPSEVSVLMDEGLLEHETILIGGGEVGIEIEMNPHDVARIAGARLERIAK